MPPVIPPRRQWRGEPEAAARLAQEFPVLAGALARPESRRRVLRLMAASAALGGLAGCDPSTPDGSLVPAVRQPADIVPGQPNRYATALDDCGAGAGIVVTHDMGRPIKVEGNPAHPSSLGATSIHGQALILDFYDPDRAAGVLHDGGIATWQGLLRAALDKASGLAANGGGGLRILTGDIRSPTLGAALDRLLARYPGARWHRWDPLARDASARGLALAYGRPVELLPHVAAADTILALDSDLLGGAPGHLRHARDFAGRRNPVRAKMSRVYAAEAVPTLIGGAADHRMITAPGDMPHLVQALAAAILGDGQPADAPRWLAPAAADLKAAGRHALVHAGPDLPDAAQALVHRINERLGGRGTTFDLIAPIAHRAGEAEDLGTLMEDMRAGRVECLLMLDSNPAYTAPGFREALKRVRFSVHAAAAPDETARLASWHVPLAHIFEGWGDLRGHDGTVAIQQPQALPLYGGQDAVAVLDLLSGGQASARDAVRQSWRQFDEDGWQDALANGVVPGTAHAPLATALQPALAPPPPTPASPGLTLLIRPDPNLGDGRHANNPWLQELPRPLSKVVWDNPLLLSPATAARLGLANGQEAALEQGGVRVAVPIWVQPGLAEDVVLGWLGGGRTSAGAVGNGVGADLTSFRAASGLVTLRPTGRHVAIASTDHHNALEIEREAVDEVVRHGTLAQFAADPGFLRATGGDRPAIYAPPPATGVAWGMSVDLNACIGCNACVVACQAENNVPVVGKEQVLIGREMHWLRIDRYYEGPPDDPETYLQPMLCMHCEQAPCEPVCPVEASVHDSEGLNLQVYNRCIGTRFCSNNCPYKVRRFNFGAWAAEEHRPAVSRNPDVTVRSRGVMEKCTFCVQRIAKARIAHDIGAGDTEVVTACQAACPTQVFSFGDINDVTSDVAGRKRSPLDYALLAEQNTRPRLTYEARIANRNPALDT
jgi:Fe-S-cluster-containing dehydrogenase component